MRDNTTEMRLAALELAVRAITTEVLRLMPADEALERVELRKVTLDAIPDAAPAVGTEASHYPGAVIAEHPSALAAAPAKRWWVVDRRADVRPSASEQSAKMDADQWDVRHSNDAPHLAIEAATKAEALAEYRRRVGGRDDVATLREQGATLTNQVSDARARAELQRKRDEELLIEADRTIVQLRDGNAAKLVRAERAEAEVARLRALCGDAALTLICATEWHVRGPYGEAGKMHARLTAAARGDT